jgi:hypothetical protein
MIDDMATQILKTDKELEHLAYLQKLRAQETRELNIFEMMDQTDQQRDELSPKELQKALDDLVQEADLKIKANDVMTMSREELQEFIKMLVFRVAQVSDQLKAEIERRKESETSKPWWRPY